MKFTLSTAAAVLAFTSSAFALAPHPARRSASQPQPSVDPRLQKAVDDVWLAKMHVAAIDMCDKSGMLFDFDKKGVDFMCSLAGGKMQPVPAGPFATAVSYTTYPTQTVTKYQDQQLTIPAGEPAMVTIQPNTPKVDLNICDCPGPVNDHPVASSGNARATGRRS